MLMSGTDNHLAGVGVMSEQRANDYERWNKRGHEGYLSELLPMFGISDTWLICTHF